MEILNRFFQDAGQSYFLFGPRGTGKSTWVKQHLKTALYIDLLAFAFSFSYTGLYKTSQA
jgi:predicted kinase